MAAPVIELEGIGKHYRVQSGATSYLTLRDAIMETLGAWTRLRMSRGRVGEEFWALRDISLTVAPGEVVGLVGRNGAGKSTLLRILARVTRPSVGHGLLRGRIGSLLDVGTGFHPELTGRENAFLNGAILGMSHREVRARLDDIVDFAGIGQFLDTPVKHYSSGMRVRLAFAVAAQLRTEILIADEVLAVGDMEFQRRCMEAMHDMAASGRTVIFVSHNMAAVGELCTRALLLDKGHVVSDGRAPAIIREYLSTFSGSSPDVEIDPPPFDHGVALRRLTISDAEGRGATEIEWHAPTRFAVRFEVTGPLPALSLGITLVNQLGIRTMFSWIVFQQAYETGTYVAEGTIPHGVLAPGRYFISLNAERYGVEYYHVANHVTSVSIVKTTGDFGINLEDYALVYHDTTWRVREEAAGTSTPAR